MKKMLLKSGGKEASVMAESLAKLLHSCGE